jgi:hypothetical protein
MAAGGRWVAEAEAEAAARLDGLGDRNRRGGAQGTTVSPGRGQGLDGYEYTTHDLWAWPFLRA